MLVQAADGVGHRKIVLVVLLGAEQVTVQAGLPVALDGILGLLVEDQQEAVVRATHVKQEIRIVKAKHLVANLVFLALQVIVIVIQFLDPTVHAKRVLMVVERLQIQVLHLQLNQELVGQAELDNLLVRQIKCAMGCKNVPAVVMI